MLPIDDRDSYINKRIDTCGVLINNLFRNYFNKLVKDMQKQISREINNGSWRSTSDYENIINLTNVYKIIKSSTIENGIKRALATGDFGIKHISTTSKVGVAQVLSRLTYISSLSHLRRVTTPIDKSGKLVDPRKLHNTTFGYLCPAETPEGQSVGVVKNLSYMTHLTITSNSRGLYDYVEQDIIKIENISPKQLFNKVKVFINGTIVGYAKDPYNFYIKLKEKKYSGIINIYTSIVFNYNNKEIYICNDAGRLTRPVLKVKEGRLLLNPMVIEQLRNSELEWDDLLTNIKLDESIIEYIDPLEQNFSLIAMRPKELSDPKNKLKEYTHCEIHPSTIFGILASCIPFPETNQSPRNTYQCAMGKQAMGIYVSNFKNRMDKTAYVLSYPMRPLVDTRVMSMIQLNNIPSGSPVMVAIATTTGYNQEDSILVNKGSLDRGLFQATIYHTEKDEDKKIHGDQEIRCKPDPSKTKGMKFGNYDKINSHGVVNEDTLLNDKDILIAKMIPIRENRNDHTKLIKYEDQSKIIRTNEETYVDKNYLEKNGEGYDFAKSRTRALRKPVIGDKLSSRHGQKGTIGNIIPECDMPFTQNGIKPDIIINPHAIPSRMTIAQLKETLLGKILLELGLYGDGTSFGDLEIMDICKKLQDIGYESHGNELMYDGLTGQQMETKIFFGPCFYQRLKHMVKDKQHSRSIGPMVNLTRQPAEGRSRDGGLRFGEMERDCCISHGISEFTKERIYNASDKYAVHICKMCGFVASYNDKVNIHYCRMCENRVNFAHVKIPYACKLLFQELMTMNIAPRLITN
jgi:DNA-directed RNA polymerase II subunit RPB2